MWRIFQIEILFLLLLHVSMCVLGRDVVRERERVCALMPRTDAWEKGLIFFKVEPRWRPVVACLRQKDLLSFSHASTHALQISLTDSELCLEYFFPKCLEFEYPLAVRSYLSPNFEPSQFNCWKKFRSFVIWPQQFLEFFFCLGVTRIQQPSTIPFSSSDLHFQCKNTLQV